MRVILLPLLLLLTAAPSAAVELTAAGQMAAAKTAWNEAGGDPSMRAVVQVMFFRAHISGEPLLTVIKIKDQFSGFSKPWKATPEQMAEAVMLVADVWGKGDYGQYTHFWPVYKNDKNGKRVLNPMPSWWQGPRVRNGGHWLGKMPIVTSTKRGAALMLRNLAASSPALARMIFPHREKIEIVKR